jgi:hypothetical protein
MLPIESEALFDPPPPTAVGALTEAVFPDAETDADGPELTGPDWTLPIEFDELLPPPACTVPTELDAEFPPDPVMAVGAAAAACTGPSDAETDGFTVVEPA